MKALATWSPAPFLSVTAIQREESRRLVTVYSRERACCPVCGVQSSSRHSFYSRTLGDLSAQGTPVTIRVRVGRWRCRNERCDRQIFAERLPGIAAPSARQTDRLAEIVSLFGHSAGGRPSERLMVCLGMRLSDSTILRRVKQHARTLAGCRTAFHYQRLTWVSKIGSDADTFVAWLPAVPEPCVWRVLSSPEPSRTRAAIPDYLGPARYAKLNSQTSGIRGPLAASTPGPLLIGGGRDEIAYCCSPFADIVGWPRERTWRGRHGWWWHGWWVWPPRFRTWIWPPWLRSSGVRPPRFLPSRFLPPRVWSSILRPWPLLLRWRRRGARRCRNAVGLLSAALLRPGVCGARLVVGREPGGKPSRLLMPQPRDL
jgi:hypothetical protein